MKTPAITNHFYLLYEKRLSKTQNYKKTMIDALIQWEPNHGIGARKDILTLISDLQKKEKELENELLLIRVSIANKTRYPPH